MAKSLVIVESPAKAKTIRKYLGPDYEVRASMGHVRDLPRGAIGVDIEHGFAPTYQVMADRARVIREIAAAAKAADTVFLAPDPDREGEAIAWHVVETLRLPESKVFRVMFNEITRRAVEEAFRHPGRIDMARVNAQQARRVLDRIVGYQLSPLLWRKVAKGLSAGRVQSVAVRLIVEREKEIRAFVPEEYWQIVAKLTPAGAGEAGQFTAELAEWRGEKFKVSRGDEARAIADALRSAAYAVESVEKKRQEVAPPPPFNTSLLQQAASTRLRFPAKRTMRVAQQLYEGVEVGSEGSVGLITYMRTDSFRVSPDAIEECRGAVQEMFGERYLHPTARHYKSRKGAQEAHEAIRPTSVRRTPDQVKAFLSPEQHRLYELIWTRFMATQMASAVYDVTEAGIRAGDGLFRAKGRVCAFDGFTRIAGQPEDKDAQVLPLLEPGQRLDLLALEPEQHFTEPPRRYTEASLVRTLEREGIGRPSTYATIISTIQERGYVSQEKRAFYATDLGILVTDLLVESFPRIMDVGFTAGMEERLDKIEEEHLDWVAVLTEFYEVFKASLEQAEQRMKKAGGGVVDGEKCAKCGKALVERWSRAGRFVGCSGYPGCDYVRREEARGEAAETGLVCHKCGKPMVNRMSRRGPFLSCSGYPECRTTMGIGRDGKPKPPPEPTEHVCEKCGKPMVIRTGRRGRFLACSGFPKCRNARNLDEEGKPAAAPEPTGEVCEKCGKPMVIRTGSKGKFVACTGYPKCRWTRPAPTDVPCPREGCGGMLIYRRGAPRKKGVYACTNPKCDYTTPELPKPAGGPEEPREQ